jgi:hypothetical protein
LASADCTQVRISATFEAALLHLRR